ncbi:MAG: hypothetical protein A3E37_03760 [Candidatus Andersenbacteria bacterium RIFCSPHIGHO2_12_FULL_46_9]|nr:MAG: hypothetical protein UW94_C0005G0131 [Parcubacteria group bacterium GW2011_GWA2_45_14]OGY33249.1 MAG: hypothetical protein A3B76_00970 [Candidatus Andersenbacteria bacterium RIFCSPHIGHO2_02_FULL_46_16]OGY38353.1 MAG: hypothetical protein A3E37_03760 [Candidatus Andersenbacteria bacterium RIFCSPHIGHO2_12_FULL_46_9]OGY38422.1 MAG: hypothetical protein A3I08_02615 [Candidatus Andersenbacteria bacterium RIFCSPLOWO2_02_FULL_46_11]HBE90546.1 hypothetical protein [Candidatus Andersenbacteria b
MSAKKVLCQILCLVGNTLFCLGLILLYTLSYLTLVFAASLIVTIALTFFDSPVTDFARAYSFYGLIVYVLLGLLTIFAMTTEDFMDRWAGTRTYVEYLFNELLCVRFNCLLIPLCSLSWPYSWFQIQRDMDAAGCGENIADAFIRPLDYWYHHKYWAKFYKYVRANEKDSTY